MNQEVKSIYAELKGYYHTLPESGSIHEKHIWDDFNDAIDKLNEITKKDYSKFKIEAQTQRLRQSSYQYVAIHALKMKLGGVLSVLQSEYFSDQMGIFENSSGTVINQNVSQTNIVHILFEFNDLIDGKLKKFEDGSSEKSFLEKIKYSLKTVSGVNELIMLIFKLGTELGLTAEQIHNIFK